MTKRLKRFFARLARKIDKQVMKTKGNGDAVVALGVFDRKMFDRLGLRYEQLLRDGVSPYLEHSTIERIRMRRNDIGGHDIVEFTATRYSDAYAPA